jgi:hypothetical protein
MRRTLSFLFVLAAASDLGAAEPRATVLGRVDGLADIVRGAEGGALAQAGDRLWRISPAGIAPDSVTVPAPERRPDLIPDGRVARGTRDIAAAWLALPTTRYGHGALGDRIEAEALRVERRDGRVFELRLGPESVFEDLEPRLADIDGDGRDEVVVVRSYLAEGAAVAVYRLNGERLAPVAESPPIGRPNRWLNPVGIADFDGDGRTEIAVVETPHIDGILVIYDLDGGRLIERGRLAGFSNHASGTTVLAMAAVLTGGAGGATIVLPGSDRRSLEAVGFAGGRFARHWSAALPLAVATTIVPVDLGGGTELVLGLVDGTIVAVAPGGEGKRQ